MANDDDQARPAEPALGRPIMPAGYGLPQTLADPAGVSWDRARQQLIRSRNYWVSTTSPRRRPHAMPVWGLWMEETFYFGTDRKSRKGRNLAANPEVVVHLESGDDVVVLEGSVEEAGDPAVLARYAEAYEAKYQFRPDPRDPQNAVYMLRPRVALTWLEADFLESAARWTFGRS